MTIQICITGKQNGCLFAAAQKTMPIGLGAGFCYVLGLSPHVVVSNLGEDVYSM